MDSCIPPNAQTSGPLTDELQHRELDAALYHHILVSTALLPSISVLTLICLIDCVVLHQYGVSQLILIGISCLNLRLLSLFPKSLTSNKSRKREQN